MFPLKLSDARFAPASIAAWPERSLLAAILASVKSNIPNSFFLYFSGQLELEDFPDIYKLPDSVKEKLDSYFQ